jgi:hypothetical protein
MAQASPSFAMDPIHPIQALHDAHPTPARQPQWDNLASPTDYQNSFTGWVGWIMYNVNSTRL